METFSASLALCVGYSPVTGEFPSQRPVTRSFDLFFDLRLNKRLSKQSRHRWFEIPSRPFWRHCNILVYSSVELYLYLCASLEWNDALAVVELFAHIEDLSWINSGRDWKVCALVIRFRCLILCLYDDHTKPEYSGMTRSMPWLVMSWFNTVQCVARWSANMILTV